MQQLMAQVPFGSRSERPLRSGPVSRRGRSAIDGASSFWIAAKNGHLGVVQYLAEVGADIDKVTNDCTSPLSVVSLNGHLGVVRFLVEQGDDKDKNKADNNGTSPLYAAAQNGHIGVVQYLVEIGATKDKTMNDGANRS